MASCTPGQYPIYAGIPPYSFKLAQEVGNAVREAYCVGYPADGVVCTATEMPADDYGGPHIKIAYYNAEGSGYEYSFPYDTLCDGGFVEVPSSPSGGVSGTVTLSPVQFDALSALLIGFAVVAVFGLGYTNGAASA